MNKKTLYSALALTFTTASISTSASAALASNAVLQFANGSVQPIECSACDQPGRFGSYFAIDLNGDGTFSINESTALTRFQGVQINSIQRASGSHPGSPNGSESPSIDMPFSFFGHTGMHQTTSPINILADDGAGHVTLDFSGWGITWNGINSPLGTNPSGGPGIASITCGTDCSNGDTFTLDYSSRFAIDDASGFGYCYYALHLVGTVSSVPIPATFWLFGSGLIGLAGAAHRRKFV